MERLRLYRQKRRRHARKRKQHAATLLELLAALAIVGIMLSLGAAGFSDLRARQHAYSAMQSFRSLFQFARYTAVQQQEIITVCALTEANKCTRDWHSYRKIIAFSDANQNHQLDAAEIVLRRLDWPTKLGRIRWRASLARNYIEFLTGGNTWQNGSLYYCPNNGDRRFARVLVLSHSGRSYEPGDSDGDGIREDREGEALDC